MLNIIHCTYNGIILSCSLHQRIYMKTFKRMVTIQSKSIKIYFEQYKNKKPNHSIIYKLY